MALDFDVKRIRPQTRDIGRLDPGDAFHRLFDGADVGRQNIARQGAFDRPGHFLQTACLHRTSNLNGLDVQKRRTHDDPGQKSQHRKRRNQAASSDKRSGKLHAPTSLTQRRAAPSSSACAASHRQSF